MPLAYTEIVQRFLLPQISAVPIRVFCNKWNERRLVWADLITALVCTYCSRDELDACCAQSEHRIVTIAEALTLIDSLPRACRLTPKAKGYIRREFQAFEYRLGAAAVQQKNRNAPICGPALPGNPRCQSR